MQEHHFQGIGLPAILQNKTVDLDFAGFPENRYDGFDLWRLNQFVEGQPDIYRHYRDHTILEKDFNALVAEGIIYNSEMKPTTSLYFFKEIS